MQEWRRRQGKDMETNNQVVVKFELMHRWIFDNMVEAVILYHLNGSILMINKTAANILGKESENLIGKSFYEIYPQETDTIRSKSRMVIETGREVEFTEYFNTAVGKKWFTTHLLPYKDEKNRVTAVLTIFCDITRQKQVEEELKAKTEQIEKQNKALSKKVKNDIKLRETGTLRLLDELSTGIVHEINNPLYGITNYIELLSNQINEETPKKDLEKISRGIDMIKSISNSLSNLPRVCKLNLEPTDMNILLKEVVDFSGPQIEKSGIEISLRIQEDMPVLMVDKSKMKQVFLNLLTNAVEAMSGGGRLKIKGNFTPDVVCFSFIDTGIGIPKEKIKHIFKPYYSERWKDGKRGAGLGLFIVEIIICAHNGNIKVKSTKGKGSTFEVVLPVIPSVNKKKERKASDDSCDNC